PRSEAVAVKSSPHTPLRPEKSRPSPQGPAKVCHPSAPPPYVATVAPIACPSRSESIWGQRREKERLPRASALCHGVSIRPGVTCGPAYYGVSLLRTSVVAFSMNWARETL